MKEQRASIESNLARCFQEAQEISASLEDVSQEMLQLREQVNHDPALSSSLKLRRMHHVAQLFYRDSFTRTNTLKDAIDQWRRQILLRNSHTRFVRARKNREAEHLKRLVLQAFKTYSHRYRAQKLAVAHIQSKTTSRVLQAWLSAFNMNNRVTMFRDARLSTMRKTFFQRLRKCIRRRRRLLRRGGKLDALVTCFTVVRVFNAWKRICLANTHFVSVLPDAVSLATAHLHFLRRTWRAFTQIIRLEMTSLRTNSHQIHLKHSSLLLLSCLRDWYTLHLAVSHWRLCRYKLGMHGLWSQWVRASRMRRGWDNVITTCRRAKLATYLQLWLRFNRVRSTARDKAERVNRLLLFRKCRKLFLRLHRVAVKRAYLLKKGSEAIAMYFRTLLKTPFLAWAAEACNKRAMRDDVSLEALPHIENGLHDTPKVAVLGMNSTVDSDNEDEDVEIEHLFGKHLCRYLRR